MGKKFPDGTIVHRAKGYQHIKAPGHPLADKGGWLGYHRYLVYEHVAGKPQRCSYCNYGPLPWRGGFQQAIIVDHINDIKGDDRLDNLTIACNWCNLLKSTWPIGYHEHMEAIDDYAHLHPNDRPTTFAILVDAWGMSHNDVAYNLKRNHIIKDVTLLPKSWHAPVTP
jgi:hypothetical protein